MCECGAIGVDGGQEYLRRIGNHTDMEDTSIVMYKDDYDKLIGVADWCKETHRTSAGYVCAIVRTLRDIGMFKHSVRRDETDLEYKIEKKMDKLDLMLTNGVITQEEYDVAVRNLEERNS
jgi:hypothetical protein